MPINLRYGQKAVELGFLTQQRLQMVLNKQRQLAEQGKKVSVRMILEKANLLDAEQISQVDAALNIKVVKKKTTRIPAKPAPAPAPAAEFKGDEQIPDYGAQNATEYSPPVMTPAQDLAAEPGLDPEPFDDGPGLEPEPMDAGPGFEPEPMDAGAGLEPEPMGAEADFAPEPMEDVGFTPAPIDAGPGFMPEPMDAGSGFEPEPFDAGPGLEPEPMEAQPFGEPMGFDDDQGFAPEPMGLDAEPVGFGAADEVPSLDAGPEMAEPSLDAGDEMGFGDVPSIDEPESLDTAPEPEPEVASVQDAWGEDSAPVDD
ncbi:MAG: hypothetical protein OEY28_12470, partial [Nitrospira sp.]|nr:hypothetical protein [Nitrospira sp.]